MDPAALGPKSLLLTRIHGTHEDKARRAIVVRMTEAGPEVVYGQSERYRAISVPPAFQVPKNCKLGVRLQLEKDTWFCSMQIVPSSEILTVFPDRCPDTWFAAAERLAHALRTRLAPGA